MSIGSVFRRTVACVALLGAVSVSAVAVAGDKALAESLFQEGRRLLEQKQYDLACTKFAASESQDPSPGTLLNLGKCHEAQGKTATAWATYKEAETLARNLARAEQEKVAAQRAATLEPKLLRLRLDPPKGVISGLVVERSGTVLSREALGTDTPIDPGTYTIKASAPGYESWSASVTVAANADQTVLAIPELKPLSPGSAARAEVSDDPTTTKPSSGSTRIIGWTLTGVGGAAIVGGGVLGLLTLQQASHAENDPTLCPGKQCTPEGRDEIDSARTKGLLANIGIGVGTAAVGVGVILLVTSRPAKNDDSHAGRPVVMPMVGRDTGGFSLSGSF